MDRGVISFFKDGRDLGEAFVSPDIKEGEFFPLVHTQVQCMISVFHPSVFPWFENYDNPEPIPPEPPIDLYTEESEYQILSQISGLTPSFVSDDGTQQAILQNSLEYMTKEELDALENMLNDTKPYNMRDSVKFWNDETRARISAQQSQDGKYRKSTKIKMHDNYLHGHTRAVMANARHFRESEKHKTENLKDKYFESGLDLQVQKDDIMG